MHGADCDLSLFLCMVQIVIVVVSVHGADCDLSLFLCMVQIVICHCFCAWCRL